MNSGGLEENVLQKKVEVENMKIHEHMGKGEASDSNSPRCKKAEKAKGILTFEVVELPLFVDKMKRGKKPVELVGNKWQTRGTTQNEEILENEAFNVYKGLRI